MRDLTVKLLSTSLTTNDIGVEVETTQEVECPIIHIENIYANEFYRANESGFKPTLRIRISAINYSNQPELIYNGVTYSVIRVDDNVDEVVLICERKAKNVS